VRNERIAAVFAALSLSLLLGACGESGDSDKPASEQGAAQEARANLNGADKPNAAAFPKPGGRTLEQLANTEFQPSNGQAGLATSVFTPGRNRLAFGVIGADQKFVYAPSAVYIARRPTDPAIGPIVAPADVLVTDPAYRSRQAASEGDPFAAVYAADVEFDKPGEWAVLIATQSGSQLTATTAGLKVAKASAIPDVGDKAPVVDTDTVESAGGDVKQIDTREPPSDMHETNFRDVAGKKPVALLFATPQLCQSRVCGPVVDIAAQLKEKYGEQMEFIHQEVYVDNVVEKGLRPPLQRYKLQTEPWLFVIGRDGRVAARLEGSFGLDAFERAVQAGLKS
jgi:hypothetical protein